MRPWIVLLFALMVVGCGEEKPETVSGRVLVSGKPLAGGTIVFAPDPNRGGDGPLACGEIGPDGRFSFRGGVAPGWHRVTVAAGPNASLPARYGDPVRSGQECEVRAGQSNVFEFNLTP